MHEPLLWCDIETSGLSERTDRLLEVGLVLTDADLSIVEETAVVIGWRNVRDFEMSEFVREMHEKSGLFDAVERSLLCTREAEDRLVRWVGARGADGLYMAGSGVGFDRRWLRHLMPSFAKLFHYRNFDMTTLRYFLGDEKREPVHRSLGDLHQSIEDLRRYVRMAHAAGLIALPANISAA